MEAWHGHVEGVVRAWLGIIGVAQALLPFEYSFAKIMMNIGQTFNLLNLKLFSQNQTSNCILLDNTELGFVPPLVSTVM